METTTIRQRGLAPVLFGAGLGVAAAFLYRGVAPWAGVLAGALGLLVLLSRHVLRVEGGQAAMWWTLAGAPVSRLRGAESASVREVVLAREERRGSKGRTYHVYPVRLAGAAPLDLFTEGSHAAARRLAEQVARAMRKPLRDEAFGAPVVRAPAELDLSLGERLRARGRGPAVPPLPTGSGLALERGEETAIRLPAGRPPMLALVLGLGVPLAMGAASYLLVQGEGRWIGLGAAALVLAGFLWSLAAGLRTGQLVLGRDFVAVRGRGGARRIPLARLEEVRVEEGEVLLVSDEAMVGLPYDCRGDAEARFLAGAVALAAYHGPGGLPFFSPGQGVPGEPLEPSGEADAPARAAGPGSARLLPPRKARGAGIGLFLVSTLLLGLAGWLASGNLAFQRRAVRAPGTVVHLAPSRGSKGGTVYSAVVEWQSEGGAARRTRSRSASRPAAFEVGERVQVLYDPERPDDARIDSFGELWLAPAVTGGMGAGLLALAAFLLAGRGYRPA